MERETETEGDLDFETDGDRLTDTLGLREGEADGDNDLDTEGDKLILIDGLRDTDLLGEGLILPVEYVSNNIRS